MHTMLKTICRREYAWNSTGGPSRPTSSNGTPGRYCHAQSHKDPLALSEQEGDDDAAAAAYGCVLSLSVEY